MRRAAGRAPLYALSTSLLLLQPPRLRLPARSFLAAPPLCNALPLAPSLRAMPTPPALSPWPASPSPAPRSVARSPSAAAPAATAAARTADHAARLKKQTCRPLSCLAARQSLRAPSPILPYLSARHLLAPRAPSATSSAPHYSARSCVVAADWGSSAGNAQGGAATWGRARWRRWEGRAAQSGGGLERLWMRGRLVGAHTAYGQARSTHAVMAPGAGGDSDEAQRRGEGQEQVAQAQEQQQVGAAGEGEAGGREEASAAATPASRAEVQQAGAAEGAWQAGGGGNGSAGLAPGSSPSQAVVHGAVPAARGWEGVMAARAAAGVDAKKRLAAQVARRHAQRGPFAPVHGGESGASDGRAGVAAMRGAGEGERSSAGAQHSGGGSTSRRHSSWRRVNGSAAGPQASMAPGVAVHGHRPGGGAPHSSGTRSGEAERHGSSGTSHAPYAPRAALPQHRKHRSHQHRQRAAEEEQVELVGTVTRVVAESNGWMVFKLNVSTMLSQPTQLLSELPGAHVQPGNGAGAAEAGAGSTAGEGVPALSIDEGISVERARAAALVGRGGGEGLSKEERATLQLHMLAGQLAVVGVVGSVKAGQQLRVMGRWVSSKYGPQLKATEAHAVLPQETEDIETYLAELLPGVGPKTARALLDHFGAGVYDTLNSSKAITLLQEVPGIGKLTARRIKTEWDRARTMREGHNQLVQMGIPPLAVVELIRQHPMDAVSVIQADPWAALQAVPGVPFDLIDSVARKLGCSPAHPSRPCALLQASLVDLCPNNCHVFVPWSHLLRYAARLLASCHEEDPYEGGQGEEWQQQQQEAWEWGRAMDEGRLEEAMGELQRRGVVVVERAEDDGSNGRAGRAVSSGGSGSSSGWSDASGWSSGSEGSGSEGSGDGEWEGGVRGEQSSTEGGGPALGCNDRCYLAWMLQAEREVAQQMAVRASRGVHEAEQLQYVREWVQREEGHAEQHLTAQQCAAVEAAALAHVMVLTGGPGCGKTYTTRLITRLWTAQGKQVMLCAPTGRAAQRLEEATKQKAHTIHKLLGCSSNAADQELSAAGAMGGAGVGGAGMVCDDALGNDLPLFNHNKENPLKADAIIVDEASMLDVPLVAALLAACPPDCRILFVGDKDQLPPVGPGKFLADIMGCGFVKVHRLTHIFRQAQQSHIVQHSHAILNGTRPSFYAPWPRFHSAAVASALSSLPPPPPLPPPTTTTTTTTTTDADASAPSLPPVESAVGGDQWWTSEDARGDGGGDAACAHARALSRLKTHLSHPTSPLSPAPFRTGGQARTHGEMEVVMQHVLTRVLPHLTASPRDDVQVLAPVQRGHFGVMLLNSRLQQLLNPPCSSKREHRVGPDMVFREGDRVIQLRNDYSLDVSNGDLGIITKIVHGDKKSITVHKAQGSEYPIVILPLSADYGNFFSRNLLYTGLTRARKLVFLIGREEEAMAALHRTRQEHRHTRLLHRLLEYWQYCTGDSTHGPLPPSHSP
ncbi:unnamed protein product [Closterium sp. Naga37s-1]|nr:unnamed protein product [Closterium sp. Naga37s-1]